MTKLLDLILLGMIAVTFIGTIVGAIVYTVRQPSCYMMFSPASAFWC